MPRMGRVMLANYPHHVVQRGHNRQVVFSAPEDSRRYLNNQETIRGGSENNSSYYRLCSRSNDDK